VVRLPGQHRIRWPRLLSDDHRRALVLAGLAALGFSTMDALVKSAVANVPVAVIGATRFVVQIVVLLVAIRATTGSFHSLRPSSPKLQLVRGLFLVGSTVTFWTALKTLPLSEAVALSALSPVIATVLAIPVLGERPRTVQFAGVALGTIGALLVVQPGTAVFTPASLLAVGTAISYASFEVTTRRIGKSEPAVNSLFYTALVGLAVMAGWLATGPVPALDSSALAIGVFVGVFGLAGHYFLIAALQRAPVPAVAPISYTGLIWGALYGFALFGQVPNALSAVGMIVIGAGGLLLVERSHDRRPTQGPSLEEEIEAGTWAGG
jgi:drug/metabolite transporter (DMT)-like permease